jgi:SAM-dependent methyltransferase
MHDPTYAYRVFRQHFDRTTFGRKNRGFVALELGPGDSLVSAVIARSLGADICYLVDSGDFASADLDIYRKAIAYLRSLSLSAPDLHNASSLNDVLATCNAVYRTSGLASIREIPTASVDFVWSHAVLEHIRKHQFFDYMREIRRVLRADGACSHRVDLRDHLGGALNNLRFSSGVWEADWMAHSGFYTNRLRYSEMLQLFTDAGFESAVIHVERWETLPTARQNFAPEFRSFAESDLLVSGFDVLLTPTSRLPSLRV